VHSLDSTHILTTGENMFSEVCYFDVWVCSVFTASAYIGYHMSAYVTLYVKRL